MTPLSRRWYERDAEAVAPDLLDKLLVSTVGGVTVSGRIVEVEAYTEDDPASHSHRGWTARNQVMFGPAGHLYVYLIYGMHHCLNVVTGGDGQGQAVLVRAVVPIDGIDEMRARRGDVDAANLTDGPGKLCQAFGVGLDHGGVDLTDPGSPVAVFDIGIAPPEQPITGPRVGITKAVSRPWRFSIPAAHARPATRSTRRRAAGAPDGADRHDASTRSPRA